MEPQDEIDDTNYFKTMLAQQQGDEEGPFRVTEGVRRQWTIEPDATLTGNMWRASVELTRRPKADGTDDGEHHRFDALGDYATQDEALTVALTVAQDWIAQQPLE